MGRTNVILTDKSLQESVQVLQNAFKTDPLIENAFPNRKDTQSFFTFSISRNIGVVTGISSNGLEVLDFDLKNTDKPKEVMENFTKMVSKELLNI